MDRRLAIAGAVGGGAALALLLLVFAPSTGGQVERASVDPTPPPAPRVATRPAAAPSPRPRPAPAPIADTGAVGEPPPPLPHGSLVRKVAPRPPFDPDTVYEVEQRGIATALFDRQPRLVACYHEHAETYGPVDGRPIVRATVLPDEDPDGSRVEIHIENRGTALAELDDCFAEAMSDANFGPVDVPTTLLQPIPLPSSH